MFTQYNGFDSPFHTGFNIFLFMFFIIFALIIGTFIVMIVKNIYTWNQNNHAPLLTIHAKIVSKRTHISHHRHGSANMRNIHSTSSTQYFVTFQVESGDRIEFRISGTEYGLLADNDSGTLSFQGTRYLSFRRD